MICTTVNEDLRFEIFSKAKYIVLLDEKNREVVFKEENPALNSPLKRPLVAKECVKLKADKVIAPHGSLCYPSYRILKNAKVKIFVTEINDIITTDKLKEVTLREVVYSSYTAMMERFSEAIKRNQ